MSIYYEQACAAVERPQVRRAREQSFWCMDEPVLDAVGDVVRGGMWPHQKQWWELPNFVKLLVGGYGAGKTAIGSKWIIGMALTNAPVPVAAVAPTFPMARKTLVPSIIEYLEGKRRLLGRGFWWRYNKSVHEFHIKYHGRHGLIYILTGEKPLSLRGPNLAAAWIDEPFIQPVEVFTQMIARIRHPDAVQSQLALTGTPEQLNWGYDLAIGEMKDVHDVGVVRGSSRANKVLGHDYIHRLEGAFTDKAAEAYIEGLFVDLAAGRVYYGFRDGSENGNVQSLPIPQGAELGCGMDFNVQPMSAAVFWRAGNRIHFFDEIELENADTEYMCSYLRDKYVLPDPFRNNPLRDIYPDASGSARHSSAPAGRTDFTYIKEAGFQINAPFANPKRKDRYNAVNGRLRPKVGVPVVTMEPTCKKLRKYMAQYSHEKMNKQKQMSHLLDAFSYPVSYLFPINKEVPTITKLEGH